MDSLKTLIVVAVLGGVSYAVYVSLNRTPDPRANLEDAPAFSAPTVSIDAPANGQLAAAPVASQAGYQAPPTSNAGGLPDYRSPAANPSGGTAHQAGTNQAGTNQAGAEIESFMRTIRAKLDEGKLAEAHLLLSSLYADPRLSPQQSQAVNNLLSQLAGTVIYSQQHLLEPAYTVQPGDTIERIAAGYNIPPRLLSRINLIPDGEQPPPGKELKVLRGPFNALVYLERYELVLVLDDRYAGRMSIGIGGDHVRLEGDYEVQAKTANPAYRGRDISIAAGDPNNPLGELLLDLGNQIGLHGTNDPNSLGRFGGRGSIRLKNEDMEDLFRILSVGSRVSIRR
jgi:hypothetical protein